jgi:hypothetical protein
MSEIGVRRYQTRLIRYFLKRDRSRRAERLVRCLRREQAIERVAVMEGERRQRIGRPASLRRSAIPGSHLQSRHAHVTAR